MFESVLRGWGEMSGGGGGGGGGVFEQCWRVGGGGYTLGEMEGEGGGNGMGGGSVVGKGGVRLNRGSGVGGGGGGDLQNNLPTYPKFLISEFIYFTVIKIKINIRPIPHDLP